MKPQTTIIIIIATALIIGFGMLADQAATPEPTRAQGAEARSQLSPALPVPAPPVLPPPPETLGWHTYTDASRTWSVRYPQNWRVEQENEGLLFTPGAPDAYEAEINPRIILSIQPLVNVVGARATLDEWFDAEVRQNPERFEVAQETLGNDPLFTWSEGVGEYPHTQFLLRHGELVYWFSIEASGASLHEALPVIVRSMRFQQ